MIILKMDISIPLKEKHKNDIIIDKNQVKENLNQFTIFFNEIGLDFQYIKLWKYR